MDMNSSYSGFEQSNTTIETPDFSESDKIISNTALEYCEYVLYVGLGLLLSGMGIVNNILTIIVYNKMGYRETANISMTAIAIWDLTQCASTFIVKLYLPMRVVSLGFSYTWRQITTIVFGYLYTISGYVSISLSAYVAIERCLCISMPFTVKYLLTPKVVTTTTITISTFVFCSYVVAWINYEFVYTTDPKTNVTFIKYNFNDLAEEMPQIMRYIYTTHLLYPIVSCTITSICTVIIIYHLKKASKIRSEICDVMKMRKDFNNSSSNNNNSKKNNAAGHHLSSRDRQVIKMLVVIIIITFACYVPRITFYVAESSITEFNFDKKYNNLFFVCLSILIAFDLANSSTNVFVFYFMSSQFKFTLRKMFSARKEGNNSLQKNKERGSSTSNSAMKYVSSISNKSENP